MKDLIMQILTASIQLIILVGLGYAIKYLKTKTSVENLQKYYSLIKAFVQAAEQQLGAGTGAQKKAQVVAMVQKVIGNKLSADEIDKLIESAVFEINNILKENKIITIPSPITNNNVTNTNINPNTIPLTNNIENK